ncbi:MAG TPA: DUF4965 domain-containing protein, partial [Roseiflexaceae bacterium]|nr:DUF4965 domain-containing protein [Roseiflexaceae bacterium]
MQDHDQSAQSVAFRPPAVPLVVCDPYFSVWSAADRLTDGWSSHWTGAPQPMCGLVRIDGAPYRFMGGEPRRRRASIPPIDQASLEVLPTRTIYHFAAADVELTVMFTTPLLPHDLAIMARPVTYLTFEARATDGATHDLALYFDVGATLAVNTSDQRVTWSRFELGDLQVLSCGSLAQPVLEKDGDNLRIDWGYLYLALPPASGAVGRLGMDVDLRGAFVERGALPDADDLSFPRPANDRAPAPVLAATLDFGQVGPEARARHLILAYDDLFSVEYFQRRLRPYWRRDGLDTAGLLRAAADDYAALASRCADYDQELMADLRQAGGDGYARLAALSFRQCIAAHKLAIDLDGTPLFFSKENFSNGCMATVDVTYPSSPFFLLLNPELLRAQIRPVMDYAASPRWRFAYAPHDLGRYPRANGQVYGGGEVSDLDQMPVEECGNMLLLLAAQARADGNADFALRYWPLLEQWAAYLRDNGLDPAHQLCTDDFAGHLARNVNLSLKAIVALGAYAALAEQAGKSDAAAEYSAIAQTMAGQWMAMADDGDHYRLTFDTPGTWSQKYNLVWDRLLDLNLFPPEVARNEIAFYKSRQERYGLPLDSRSSYTKLDWIVWSATLAEDPADFAALLAPLAEWAHSTSSRV